MKILSIYNNNMNNSLIFKTWVIDLVDNVDLSTNIIRNNENKFNTEIRKILWLSILLYHKYSIIFDIKPNIEKTLFWIVSENVNENTNVNFLYDMLDDTLKDEVVRKINSIGGIDIKESIEMLLALLHAYIFTMLSALYFGFAAEEHEHN